MPSTLSWNRLGGAPFTKTPLKSTLANHGHTPCTGGDVPAAGHLKGVMLKTFKVSGQPFRWLQKLKVRLKTKSEGLLVYAPDVPESEERWRTVFRHWTSYAMNWGVWVRVRQQWSSTMPSWTGLRHRTTHIHVDQLPTSPRVPNESSSVYDWHLCRQKDEPFDAAFQNAHREQPHVLHFLKKTIDPLWNTPEPFEDRAGQCCFLCLGQETLSSDAAFNSILHHVTAAEASNEGVEQPTFRRFSFLTVVLFFFCRRSR